jgi:hypothetical protein
MDLRLATLKAVSMCCTMFQHWINAETFPVAQLCVNTLPATKVTLSVQPNQHHLPHATGTTDNWPAVITPQSKDTANREKKQLCKYTHKHLDRDKFCKYIVEYRQVKHGLYKLRNKYSGPSSYGRLDIRITWVTTKKILVLTYEQILSYDPNAGQGQNVYPLVRL